MVDEKLQLIYPREQKRMTVQHNCVKQGENSRRINFNNIENLCCNVESSNARATQYQMRVLKMPALDEIKMNLKQQQKYDNMNSNLSAYVESKQQVQQSKIKLVSKPTVQNFGDGCIKIPKVHMNMNASAAVISSPRDMHRRRLP